MEIARWVDDRKQFKERLSTALEMAGSTAPAEWQQLLVADAAKHAQSFDSREILAFGLPRAARWAALLLALCAGLGFVPAYRSQAHVQKMQDAANIRDAAKNLSDLVRRELVQKPPVLPPTQKTMEQVAELGDKLGKQTLTKTEALRDLANVADKLAQQENELSRNPGMKALERAAREPGNGATATPESVQKQIDTLQKALGTAAAQSDKLDKLAKELQKFQQQAASMANNNSSSAQAAREQLAQNLADLARQAAAAGASLDGLDEAIKALQSNNPAQFVRDLETAMHDLEKLREMAKAMKALQQQAAKMGKDLAEQLKNGQAQAAQQTLQEMIDRLKSANLSPEQLEKIMDEVSAAIDPAGQYGSVGEHLKKAAQQGRAGSKSDAAQSLAAAQTELQKLMEQMADAQAIQATLDAVERAEMAIATGKGWGQCQSRYPSFAPGGRPGRGVGTWAEEEGWSYSNENGDQRWDNSGVERPDTEARGHTDRPDDLNPNLIPDKVKGQMSPGGSMPSISLKGVSIKGTSTVKFEEAAAAAQQDAQSALNQDQVPRAYQNHVRDYFDDLKK
jgi:hypothetical protein